RRHSGSLSFPTRRSSDLYEVDSRGLDRLDRAVLDALCSKFHGGPVGLSTLAIAVGEEVETVETVAVPYLVREGLLGRSPRGRIRSEEHTSELQSRFDLVC